MYNSSDVPLPSQRNTEEEDRLLQQVVPLIHQRLVNIENQQRQAFEQLSDMLKNLSSQISNISNGRVPMQITINWPQGSNLPSTPIQNVAYTVSTSVNDAAHQTASSSSTQIAFRLSTHIRTVTDLYKEWTEGINGNHSVEYMNTHHPGWFKNQKSFYMRRKRILKACEKYAADENISVLDAVQRAETIRARNKKSLDYLAKHTAVIFTLL